MDKIRCKICGQSNTRRLFTAPNIHGRQPQIQKNFDVFECPRCSLAFTRVEIGADFYKKYYLKDYYEPLFGFNNLVTRFLVKGWEALEFFRRLVILNKYGSSGLKLLEIGCGRGEFLSKLPGGFEKYGVEINKNAWSYVKKYRPNITIYNQSIDSKYFFGKKNYDMIIMWHVLEHISDPNGFLESLKKLLGKNGVLILDVPNKDSLGFNFTKNYWFHLDTPRHLFYFNHSGLSKLLEKHGLRIQNYFADPVGYFHDLPVSIYRKFRSTNRLVNFFIFLIVFPTGLLVRLTTSLFKPEIAEINTYIIVRASGK